MSFLDDAPFNIRRNEPLAAYSTWGIGGPAQFYAEVQNSEQLLALVQHIKNSGEPLFILGAGSNVLIDDAGVSGWVIRLKGAFESVTFEDDSVRCGAAVFLPALVRKCAEEGLGGIEPLVGIPGTVGGAVAMNAGTRDLEIGKIVRSVEILSLEKVAVQTLTSSEIQFQYRHSSMKNCIILSTLLQLKRKSKTEILSAVQNFLTKRLKTQPVGSKNCGSVFKNPDGNFAADLIERAGLKGVQIGGAQVSAMHANFILNLGNATSRDVKMLIAQVQETVQKKFGIHLEREVKFVP